MSKYLKAVIPAAVALVIAIAAVFNHITAGVVIAAALLFLAAVLFGIYIYRNITIPLREMKEFAVRMAEGNFDDAPEFDASGIFRPFSESFKIMNEELAKSREREMTLRTKETELMASVSNDLKSPVTGIKLTAELIRTKLLVKKDKDEDARYMIDKLDNIYNKAGHVEFLLDEMLTSALEDLGEIRVVCADVDSRVLEDMLKKCDEDCRVSLTQIPGVLIHIDNRHMSRVIENIISNSYRYANTSIDVGFLLTDEYLQMKITDHGPGVPDDEIDLITERFYRGRMWAGSDEEGDGLGLYVAKTLMEKMGGKLFVENTGDGLCVTLLIKLSPGLI